VARISPAEQLTSNPSTSANDYEKDHPNAAGIRCCVQRYRCLLQSLVKKGQAVADQHPNQFGFGAIILTLT